MPSDAQRRATAEWRRKNRKTMTISFYPDDMALYEWARSQDNTQAYIRDLIKADMDARQDTEKA